ncbi:MAG TPA: SIR2 family protein [Kofleriaceae bacterium]|nr:SIR2 family protein [Kofleriaceae bacterium]
MQRRSPMAGDAIDELRAVIASGDAMLFTGAGFSGDARDMDGKRLPDSREMIGELWKICFPDDEPDDSSLPDLYDVALMRAPDALRDYVARRLRIGNAKLPAHFRRWFSAPWQRIYTLNVDDLEVAVQRQFELPRKLRSVSAMAPDRSRAEPGAIDVVHLNGMAGADASELTFSTMQYASRLCGRDREYERLVADLLRAPFVFAGTTLDEVILWQHLELHRRRNGDPEPHSRAFLISSSLSRARRELLASLHIDWIQASIDEVADQIL